MKLIQALKLGKAVPNNAETVHVVSSTETDLFETFLKAFSVECSRPLQTLASGFGELSLALLAVFKTPIKGHSVLVILDWEDLFPGSSFRTQSALHSTLGYDSKKTDRLIEIITSGAESAEINKIVIVLPVMASVPLTSVSRKEAHWQFQQQSLAEAKFVEFALIHPKISIINSQEVLSFLARDTWTSLSGLYQSGWPYSTEATSELAKASCEYLTSTDQRKKVLITDLDETLWRGVIGEVGSENVDFSSNVDGYKHLIYQKLLNRLMTEGVLVAVCSKNESAIAQSGLNRPDLLLDVEKLVNIRADWEPKSSMIEKMLREINILPQDAVFVDDSEFELEEVGARLPEITTVRFPRNNSEFLTFVNDIQDLFAVTHLTEEDKRRTDHYKTQETFQKERRSIGNIEEYLDSLRMVGRISEVDNPHEKRPLQLVNKTNQFNLNGLRETTQSWKHYFNDGARILKVELDDCVSNYGVVAILVVKENIPFLDIYQFVLSCRVFSRQLEFGVVDYLNKFAQTHNMDGLRILYASTGRNKVLTNFLVQLGNKQATLNEENPRMIEITLEGIRRFPGILESSVNWEAAV